MSASTWFTIGMISFALAGISAIIAVILFIRLDIPAIIGDLSGKKAAREVKAIKEDKKYQSNNLFYSSNTQFESDHSGRFRNIPANDEKRDIDLINDHQPPEHIIPGTTVLSDQTNSIWTNQDVHDQNQQKPTEETTVLSQNRDDANKDDPVIPNKNEDTVSLTAQFHQSAQEKNVEGSRSEDRDTQSSIEEGCEATTVLEENESTATVPFNTPFYSEENDTKEIGVQDEKGFVTNQKDLKTASLETAALNIDGAPITEATQNTSNLNEQKAASVEASNETVPLNDSSFVSESREVTEEIGAAPNVPPTMDIGAATIYDPILAEGTTVLSEGTAVLSQFEPQTEQAGTYCFTITREIIEVHTDEVIE